MSAARPAPIQKEEKDDKQLLAAKINARVREICFFGSFNKPEASIAARFASHHGEKELQKNRVAPKIKRDTSKYLTEYYHPGIAPPAGDRELFFRCTLNGIKLNFAIYGWGNCGPMADVAFLEAVNLPVLDTITYVRFLDTTRKTEEVNTLVIGDWPKPGCVVVSPWDGYKGENYVWGGSTAKTPQLNKYNTFSVLFSLGVKDKRERKQFKKMLDENDYKNWKNTPERKQALTHIVKFSLLACDMEAIKIMKDKRPPRDEILTRLKIILMSLPYLKFKDLLVLLSVSKGLRDEIQPGAKMIQNKAFASLTRKR